MLSDLLKEKTKTPHQELEKLIISKITQLNSAGAYASFLKVFYGYIAPIESSLSNILAPSVITDFASRRKSQLLLDDLAFLEKKDGNLPLAVDIPGCNTITEALGAMYVLEGSTLGGKYITRMISERLNLQPEKGFSFFNGYKEDTGVMWSRFQDKLNTFSQDPDTENEIIDAANQTFEKFKKWIDEQ